MTKQERLQQVRETLANEDMDIITKSELMDEQRGLEIELGERIPEKPSNSPYECVGCSA